MCAEPRKATESAVGGSIVPRSTSNGDDSSCGRKYTLHPSTSLTGRRFLKPKCELGVLGHHLRGPGWVEDHLRVNRGDSGEVADELLHLLGDLGPDRAGGGREGEGDIDLVALDVDVVDEAEGDEVEPELGIDHFLEGLEDVVFAEHGGF